MTSTPLGNHEYVISQQPGAQNSSHGASAPIQPGGYPQPNTICPPGLESLMYLDKMFIHQLMEIGGVFTAQMCANKYAVMDVRGQQLFYIQDKTDFLERLCCGSNGNVEISIYDIQGRVVLTLSRPMSCLANYFSVYAGPQLLGSVSRDILSCSPTIRIYDNNEFQIFKLTGPFCMCGLEIDFSIRTNDGTEVGMIRKYWRGILDELFTTADTFGASFPLDLNVQAKALILAALILLDFQLFEK